MNYGGEHQKKRILVNALQMAVMRCYQKNQEDCLDARAVGRELLTVLNSLVQEKLKEFKISQKEVNTFTRMKKIYNLDRIEEVLSTSGGSNSLNKYGRARRTLTTETNSNINSTMGVGSSNGSITRSNYSVNDLIAGGKSMVSRENNGSSLKFNMILEQPHIMVQHIATSDTLIPSPSNNKQIMANKI